MKVRTRQWLSMLLAIVMTVSLLPAGLVSAAAAGSRPEVGFFSEPTAGQGSELNGAYTVTEDTQTIYCVAGDVTFVSIEPSPDFEKFADFELDSSKEYVAVTFKEGVLFETGEYQLRASMSNGEELECSIRLTDGRIGLRFRWAEMDKNTGIYQECLDKRLEREWISAPGYSCMMTLYFVEGGKETLVDLSRISISGPITASRNSWCGPNVLLIYAADFGTGTITYTHTDGKTYTLACEIGLPDGGFYAKPDPDEKIYLWEYAYRADSADKTFYYAPAPGKQIVELEIDPEFEKIATVDWQPGDPYAIITLKEVPEDNYYYIKAKIKDGDRSNDVGSAIRLYEDFYGFFYRLPGYGGVEAPDIYTDLFEEPMTDVPASFYFGWRSDPTSVDIDELTCSGEVSVTKSSGGRAWIHVGDFGVSQISYEVSADEVHVIEVEAGLPGWATMYKKPERSERNYLYRSFTATRNSKTFYLMPGDGFLFDELIPSPELEAIAELKISDDRTYASVTITDNSFRSGTYMIEEMGHTVPGSSNHWWGNSNWSFELVNDIRRGSSRPSSDPAVDPAPTPAPTPAPAPAPTAVPGTVTNADGTKAEVSVDAVTGTVEVKVEVPKNVKKTTVNLPVQNVTSTTVAVIVHPDGTREVVSNCVPTADGLAVTLTEGAALEIVDNKKSFSDTENATWAKDAIDFVSSREIFAGYPDQKFGVDDKASRSMVWTVLAKLSGEETSGGKNWYDRGQNWAKEQGISDGMNPDGEITREQMAVMLWRVAGSPAPKGNPKQFDDRHNTSSWAEQAMDWMVENGLLSGKDGNKLDPQGLATRAELAVILSTYMQNVGI